MYEQPKLDLKDILPHSGEIESNVEAVLKICSERSIQTLPTLSFVMQQAKKESPETNIYRVLANKLLDLTNMSAISTTTTAKATDKDDIQRLLKWRALDLQNLTESFGDIGISITPEELDSRPPEMIFDASETQNEFKMSELLRLLQVETAGLYAGTRVIEEVKKVANICIPKTLIPKNDVIAVYQFGNLRAKNNGSAGLVKIDAATFAHCVAILDGSYGGSVANLSVLKNIMQSTNSVILGTKAEISIRAAHEYLGHSKFYELFKIDEMEKYLQAIFEQKDKRENSGHLDDALNEGYAILGEEMFGELLNSVSNMNDRDKTQAAVLAFRDARREHSDTYQNHATARVYADGQRLMQNLIIKLGIEKLSMTDQMVKLQQFITQIDLVKLSEISAEDAIYQTCIRDPLGHLPMKDHPNPVQ